MGIQQCMSTHPPYGSADLSGIIGPYTESVPFPTDAAVSLYIVDDGSWAVETLGGGIVDSGTWHVSGNLSKFQVQFDVTSGALDSANGDTWLPISGTLQFYVTMSGAGTSTCSGTVSIKSSYGGPVLDSISVTLTASSDI